VQIFNTLRDPLSRSDCPDIAFCQMQSTSYTYIFSMSILMFSFIHIDYPSDI